MVKKLNSQRSLFQEQIPQMPEGYYSGDEPNLNLQAFVEQHMLERPYDPDADSYDVPAFDKPIDTTKATAIYNMHTYWSKKPHDAIRQYIRHYTQSGDLVLDPFCGSGGTALAALMEGRKAIAIDRSPAATFITKNYCTPVSVQELQKAFEELKLKVKPEIDWLYETRCDRCGGKATTAYTVYSQVFQCPRCMEKVPLFDCFEIEGQTAKGKPKKLTICPHCHLKGVSETISTRAEKFGAIPVLVSYLCENGCKPVRSERRHNDPDPRKREYFEQYDYAKIMEIEGKQIPHWYPDAELSEFIPYRMLKKKDFRPSDAKRLIDLFTKRNLWALAAIRTLLPLPGAGVVTDSLLFSLEGILLINSRMCRAETTQTQNGTYYLPAVFKELKPINSVESKINVISEANHGKEIQSSKLCISTQSSILLGACESNSVDYIFTDPPYADNVQYGELNFIWEAWLGFDTNWHEEEIIVNEVRGKSETDWAIMMKQAMAECFRVLKPGRWLSLCYHDTSEGTWGLVQQIMIDVGFLSDTTESALFIDTGQKSYNQLTADKVTMRDLVINFRKPKSTDKLAYVCFSGQEDDRTFMEKARSVIRQFLERYPGTTKDRIYDELISRMVRKGEMEAHDFETLLRDVAEEVRQPVRKNLFENAPRNLFGTHQVGRWHLKETEAGADEAEQATADSAVAGIQEFITRMTAAHLKDSDPQVTKLSADLARLRERLQAADDGTVDESRGKLVREIHEASNRLEKLEAQRSEWKLQALHYSDLFEFYLTGINPKPKATMEELLEDYCYQTDAGNWRPPLTDEEKKEKSSERQRAVRRLIQRLYKLLENGQAVPESLRPDTPTLMEWIRHCRRTGLHIQGKLLYEQGGLDLSALSEEEHVNVEEDYQVCVRALQHR